LITLDRIQNSDGEHIQLKVRDDGKGITEEFIPIIFNRFSQVDSTSTRAYGGLGLGLVIVKQLVELHEGVVSVESLGDGKGSTFTVLLPIKLAVKNCKAEAEAEAELSLQGLRILLVDDDSDLREAFAFMFQFYGAETRTAETVSAGFIILKEFKPDILISDISMPVEDGYSLIKKVRALESPLSKIPALALTAYAGIEDIQLMHVAGFQSHISKPVDTRKLILAIAKLVLSKS
jgi:CheY-like chemotaxis protein